MIVVAERIRAAIDVLEARKAQPQPPFYTYFDPETMDDGDNDNIVSTAFNAGTDWGAWAERTQMADAQLMILTRAYNMAVTGREQLTNGEVSLANAILGLNQPTPDPH